MDEIELPRGRPFLTARWCNLLLANFAVPDELLLPRLPDGLQLDRWRGSSYVSLVAFDFERTRVLGVPWPGYRNFPELNLRFYVRHGRQRGVVFIREYIGLRMVAKLARLIYNEPYVVAPLASCVAETADSVAIEHRLNVGGRVHTFRAIGEKPGYHAGPGSLEEFFKEQAWGFGRSRRGHTIRYRVSHPPWESYAVREYSLDLDWGVLYGPEWAALNGVAPDSVVLAAGSAVEVYPKGRPPAPVESVPVPRAIAGPVPG